MEAKDLVLLMLIPVILIGIIVYTDNPNITGLVAAEQEQSNIIGTYSIMPSFKVNADYSLEDYKEIMEKLDNAIEECKIKQDVEQCIKEKTNSYGWNCDENEAAVLSEIVDKLNDCTNLKEENVVCRFSIDEREFAEKREFKIILTEDYKRVKAELKEDDKVLATDYIDMEALEYTGYDNRDGQGLNAGYVVIEVAYEPKETSQKPSIRKAYAKSGPKTIDLSRIFLLYKTKDEVKFIDFAEEQSFRAPLPANVIIDLPRTKGIKFCAKSDKQLYAYDNSDNKVELRNIIYKFAVTFPRPPPKAMETLEAFDALKAENSVILIWEKSNDASIKAYNIYYSKKDFIDVEVKDIKKDEEIKKISAQSENPAQIDKIDLTKCSIDIGSPCKYSLYNKPLEKNRLYLTSEGKFIYLISDVEDGSEHNYAVTAVNDEGTEIDNDKAIEDNNNVLSLNKNYRKFTSKDDLEPGRISGLQAQSSNGKVKLTWDKPTTNIDGSTSFDIASFNIYYKKSILALPDKIDRSYAKKTITAAEANCDNLPDVSCEFTPDLEKGQNYGIGITAADEASNEYTDAEIIQVTVA